MSTKFAEDIPNESWLAEKLEDTDMSGRNEWGVPKRMGPITGSFSQALLLPVSLLRLVPGERGEQDNVRVESRRYIMDHWDEIEVQSAYMEIDPYGKAWISEGNHRIMAAAVIGKDVLFVDVRYYSGGQRKCQDQFSPDALLRMDAEARRRQAESKGSLSRPYQDVVPG